MALRIEDIIRRPLITEKNTWLMESSQYTFEVDLTANKIQIKEAVETTFNVRVLAVNTLCQTEEEISRGQPPWWPHQWRHGRLEESDCDARPGRSRSISSSRSSERRRKENASMAIRKYKPTSPGRRSMSVSTFEEITKNEPEKNLIEPLKSKAGRNNHGRITVRHRGGGHEALLSDHRLQAQQDRHSGAALPRSNTIQTARPASRCSFYADGEKRYILAPLGLKVGDDGRFRTGSPIRVGNALPLREHPDRYADPQHRAAQGQGRTARPLGRRGRAVDGEVRATTRRCVCHRARCAACTSTAWRRSARSAMSITRISRSARPDAARYMGKRPTVRGSVMNPRDHPHGGGEGKAPIGGQPKTPWGKPAFQRTRNNKRTDSHDRSSPSGESGAVADERVTARR